MWRKINIQWQLINTIWQIINYSKWGASTSILHLFGYIYFSVKFWHQLVCQLCCNLPYHKWKFMNECILLLTRVTLTFTAGGQLVFTGRQNSFNWTSSEENLFRRWSNQAGKIILTAGQFACCPAPNETPDLILRDSVLVCACVNSWILLQNSVFNTPFEGSMNANSQDNEDTCNGCRFQKISMPFHLHLNSLLGFGNSTMLTWKLATWPIACRTGGLAGQRAKRDTRARSTTTSAKCETKKIHL